MSKVSRSLCCLNGNDIILIMPLIFLLLGGKLLAERCRTDDLMPSIPILCLPPSRVDPKVLGLDVLIYHSQPGGSWTFLQLIKATI